ncbi:hypothetical protein [Acinetobacter sp. WZC-1]|uniref:hypothetical protein n=1 Tax=Acinetobacter sp. WZC-1 TaxID=3459034 RepID=UPI00403DFFFD
MLNLIKFFPEEGTVGIFLDDEYERFILSTKDWTKGDYINQWKHAVMYALKNREVSGIIKYYECAKSKVKKMSIYTIIPEEQTKSSDDFFSESDANDFFITESFLFITENEKTFTSNEPFDQIKETYGNYFPIFYFDKYRIDKFYLYLSDNIHGMSSWKIKAEDLESVLNLSE